MKVLVVDDDSRNNFALSAFLKRVGVEVLTAEGGVEGVKLLTDSPDLDLVLVDIMMPGMDGYATMRAMRKLASGASIPLVAFTAKVEAGERERCFDAGASAYLQKPVDTSILLRVLGEWLAVSSESPLPPEIEPALELVLPPGAGSMSGMRVLVVDDDFRSIFALSALLKRLQVQTFSAESGAKGIETLEATPEVHLVLVDIMMPGMDGYATMRAIRELPSAEGIPLVAFTARTEAGERQRCFEAGASAYIPKPLDTAELLGILSKWYPSPLLPDGLLEQAR
jgi:CheY-like chemotaxis protein